MGFTEIKKSKIENINDHCEFISKIDTELIVRKSDLGSLALIELEDLFNNLKTNCVFVWEADLTSCSDAQLERLISLLNSLRQQVNEVMNVKITQLSTSSGFKNQLLNNFNSYGNQFIEAIMPVQINELVYGKNAKEIKGAVAEFKKRKNKIEQYENESKIILENIKQASGEIGVASYATIFETQANTYKTLAKSWLKAVITLIVILTFVTIIFLFCPPKFLTTSESIHFSVTKVILFAILFFALSLCVRNYRAHKHNEVVNEHRKNALNAFEVFSKASSADTATQNAVLLAATNTIFSNQQTGYIMDDKENDNPKIIEIIKTINPKATNS